MAIEKHINFFVLQKASVKPGCFLCRIIDEQMLRYIDNMLFEHISDRGFRSQYRSAGGFCSFHSKTLLSFRDGLAVAILSRDILEDRICSFEKKESWHPKSPCPICQERIKTEEGFLSFLAESDGDSPEERELRTLISASDGLCAHHYANLIITPKGKKRRLPDWLRDFHEAKFRELKRRLDLFIELSAYGRQEEFSRLSDKDKLVWKEAAEFLRGNTG